MFNAEMERPHNEEQAAYFVLGTRSAFCREIRLEDLNSMQKEEESVLVVIYYLIIFVLERWMLQ